MPVNAQQCRTRNHPDEKNEKSPHQTLPPEQPLMLLARNIPLLLLARDFLFFPVFFPTHTALSI
jgi:hypothetical protein